MFDLRNFVWNTLVSMADTEPEYKVRQYALGWFRSDVLTEEDLAEIEGWYEDETEISDVPAEEPGEDDASEQ